MIEGAILNVTLNGDFLEAVEAADREPSQVVADLMNAFVERHRRGYQDFLQAKVEEGRRCAARGEVYDSVEVERESADLRGELRARS